jgi:hypothetical protein
MPSRASKRKDFTQTAKAVFDAAVGDAPKPVPPGTPPENDTRNPHAVAMSKLGAAKGGNARAESLSAAKRIAIAKKAAKARWGKKTS